MLVSRGYVTNATKILPNKKKRKVVVNAITIDALIVFDLMVLIYSTTDII